MRCIKLGRTNSIKFNAEKIQYFDEEVRFLGLIFNKHGYKTEPEERVQT